MLKSILRVNFLGKDALDKTNPLQGLGNLEPVLLWASLASWVVSITGCIEELRLKKTKIEEKPASF